MRRARVIVGAFRYNRTVGDGFTALGARLLTALLALFVGAKVQEKLEKFGKGELDVVCGALIPLAVLGLVYRYGVRPMIGGVRRFLTGWSEIDRWEWRMHGFKGRFPLWHDICYMFDDTVKRQEETRPK